MYNELMEKLGKYGQEHVLSFWGELGPDEQKKLSAQIDVIDWDYIDGLIKEYVLKKSTVAVPENLLPAPFFPLIPANGEMQKKYNEARSRGVELLKAGKVAALTVAGGQGTRLGFDGPKGTFPISPVKKKTLFQYFAESISRISAKYGKPLHWFIMTSEMNDRETRDFFEANSFFGLMPSCVSFFTQGTMPAVGYDGKLLLGAKSSLALSPNGHGGTLLALRLSGCLEKMKSSGIDVISYFQVDNPLAPIADPLFIGLHSLEKSEISAKMLPKTGPYEKLGNFCMVNGKLHIIEYSDMPAKLAEERKADGPLRFLAGSPAIHMISREFAEKLTANGKLELPWHKADKKVPCIDANGNSVNPSVPNAIKLESFIFDALPMASKTMILEGARENEFAPVKNPSGVDSAESCRAMLIERDAKRLEKAGFKIPRKSDGSPDCLIELSPRSAVDDEDAAELFIKNKNLNFLHGEELYLE